MSLSNKDITTAASPTTEVELFSKFILQNLLRWTTTFIISVSIERQQISNYM